MTYAVHFGTRTRLGAAQLEALWRCGPYLGAFQDGDGWETWGDQPGIDNNDADTLHTIVTFDAIGAAIDYAVSVAQGALADLSPVPMLRQSQARSIGVVCCVTDTDDWSIDYALTYFSGVLRLLDASIVTC